MIEANEAFFLINKNITRFEEEIKVIDSQNRICSLNIYSLIDYPYFDNSAVDGYMLNLNYVTFDLNLKMYFMDLSSNIIFSGDKLLNDNFFILNFAYEICTGAFVSKSFNCVIAKENIYINENKIFFSYFPKFGENIRLKGEGFKKGDLIISVYESINSLKIAFLLSSGIEKIFVFSFPKVLLLSTGDELVSCSDKISENKIYNSNIFMINNELKKNFIFGVNCFFSNDNYKNITNILSNYLFYNLVIVLGGMSFGKHDFTRDAFNKLGVREVFFLGNWKPGKPLYFGVSKGVYFFGLPGNPNSCYITFKVFVEYFINNFVGNIFIHFFLKGHFSFQYFKKNNCLLFLHGILINKIFIINENQNSNLISNLSNSNAIIFLNDCFYENSVSNLITYIFV